MKANRINEQDEKIILDLFSNKKMSCRKIAKETGFYHVNVSKIIKKNNLDINSNNRTLRKVSESDEIKILYLYLQYDKTITQISKELGIWSTKISRILKKHNIKIIPARAKYNFNKNYFDIVDSKDKATFLGLLFADGFNCEEDGYVSIGLERNDLDALETFKKYINANHPINEGEKKRNGKITYFGELTLCDRRFSEKLASLGCVQRKTFKKVFPAIKDKELIKSFIYGYFLGNGWLCYKEYKNKKRYYYFGICSNPRMLNSFKEIFDDMGFESSLYLTQGKTGQFGSIHIFGNDRVDKIVRWLFKDEIYLMERKNRYYQEFINYMEFNKK